jgi:predicted DsbA family dithiol-disulfide isomerase
MKSLGIDSTKVMSCVETQGIDLLAENSKRAQELSVTGSPSLVINGAIVQPSSRTAEAFKSSVCSGFNNAPETCGIALDSTTVTSSGNC